MEAGVEDLDSGVGCRVSRVMSAVTNESDVRWATNKWGSEIGHGGFTVWMFGLSSSSIFGSGS